MTATAATPTTDYRLIEEMELWLALLSCVEAMSRHAEWRRYKGLPEVAEDARILKHARGVLRGATHQQPVRHLVRANQVRCRDVVRAIVDPDFFRGYGAFEGNPCTVDYIRDPHCVDHLGNAWVLIRLKGGGGFIVHEDQKILVDRRGE
jgi:hypothetical protein